VLKHRARTAGDDHRIVFTDRVGNEGVIDLHVGADDEGENYRLVRGASVSGLSSDNRWKQMSNPSRFAWCTFEYRYP
jgi:hypothetical protein